MPSNNKCSSPKSKAAKATKPRPIMPKQENLPEPDVVVGGQAINPVQTTQPLQSIENILTNPADSQQDSNIFQPRLTGIVQQAIIVGHTGTFLSYAPEGPGTTQYLFPIQTEQGQPLVQSRPEIVLIPHNPAPQPKPETVVERQYPQLDDIFNFSNAASLSSVEGSAGEGSFLQPKPTRIHPTIARETKAPVPVLVEGGSEIDIYPTNVASSASLNEDEGSTDDSEEDDSSDSSDSEDEGQWRYRLLKVLKKDVEFTYLGQRFKDQFKGATDIEIRKIMEVLEYTLLTTEPFEFLAARNVVNRRLLWRSDGSQSVEPVELNLISNDERLEYVNKYRVGNNVIPVDNETNMATETSLFQANLNRFMGSEGIFQKHISQYEFIDLLDM